MTITTPLRPSRRTVETIALTESSWRVCDADLPDDDATRLIAYVEQNDVGFEVLWMWPFPGSCTTYAALDEAFEAVTERLRQRRTFREAS
ncbi:hypothetical protein ELQ92_05750 [Labedella populi]|uniref:Uncharacterized protein n=1 Tax=Labedella populi TaxID=2498850 RepID=A0A444QC43_9MICO|nr:hypothetical protein [Labedella populi]RWZ64273.1 hypothetical protein ELQ92_05750 [Labedella populi]